MDDRSILFYDQSLPFPELSNFHPAPITLDGLVYPTSEHLYQSLKFVGSLASDRSRAYANLIRIQSTPNKAKILARREIKGGYPWMRPLNEIIRNYPEITVRSDFNQVKNSLMRLVVFQKFLQNHDLANILFSTGSAQLVEHTARDKYWADGGSGGNGGGGQNILGRILMETRMLLQRKSIPLSFSSSFSSSERGRWILDRSILVSPSEQLPDINQLNRLGVSCILDLSSRLVQTIFGLSLSSTQSVYYYPQHYLDVNTQIIFIQGSYPKELIERFIQGSYPKELIERFIQGWNTPFYGNPSRICYVHGSLSQLQEVLPLLWMELYQIPFNLASLITQGLLN